MKRSLLLLAFISFTLTAFAQKLVEATLLETRTKEELNLVFAFLGVSVENGITSYKILYETPDTDGSIDTASGLLVLPLLEDDIPAPIVAYQHGTSSDRESVPSRLPQEAFLVYFFSGQGYVGTAADYLGLGDSRRLIHPYVHAATQATAGIDLVRAAKEFMTTEGVAFNDQLFITGYSQGGHAGMAMHRMIETELSDEFTVTAASHMSGPYNLSGTTVVSDVDEVYDFPSYLVWLFVGYQSVYNTVYEDLNTVFQPEYVDIIEQFSQGEVTRATLNDVLVEQLTDTYGASFANRLFTEEFLLDFLTNPENPMLLALQDNDVYDWVPSTPTQLLYCMADEQVNYRNAVFTDSIMNANGAPNVSSTDINSESNHGECVIPATANTAAFFAQFVQGVTSTPSINPDLAFAIRPNPAATTVQLRFGEQFSAVSGELHLQLMAINGQVFSQQSFSAGASSISLDLSTYPSGLYLLEVKTEEGIWVEKVVKK